MATKLIVVAGPLGNTVFALDEASISLGRDVNNHVVIPDISVSRSHCKIRREGNEFVLQDAGSRNATFVNGIPVVQHQLKNGDRIRLGDTVMLFLCETESSSIRLSEVELHDERMITEKTIVLRNAEDEIAQTSEMPVSTSRSANDLNVMLKLSLAINSTRRSEKLQQQLLELIGSVIPADRGAIILAEEDSQEIASIRGWQRDAESGNVVQVSRTITEKVLREAVSILSNDVMLDQVFRDAATLCHQNISALLVAPIQFGDKTIGAIYLDAVGSSPGFDQNHQELLRAIANLTAVALENLRRMNELESENHRLQAEISIDHDMVGSSSRMLKVYEVISRAAPTDATVLIRGESGTGKELAARAIHHNSPRAGQPFVAINCAALTETLLESELFGYEKGAFTGAVAQKKGKLEVAQGGTLFLDEIGEMSMLLQAKLLRVLQQREFERVGGTRTIKADLRFIAATNRNLEQAIKEGQFREDLFYRLNVITINMPPLRERREDLLRLSNYFVTKYGRKCARKVSGISPEAMECLRNYDWPGNIREFENTIERAIVLGSGGMIMMEDLPEPIIESRRAPASIGVAPQNFYLAINEMKKRLILETFQQAKGSYVETARLLEMHPNHLHRLIRNLDMKAELKK